MSSASLLLFLWQTGSSYPILEVCEFQFWQCRDSSCHAFLPIFAVSRLHLIDPSSIEHKCLLLYMTVDQSRTGKHQRERVSRVGDGRCRCLRPARHVWRAGTVPSVDYATSWTVLCRITIGPARRSIHLWYKQARGPVRQLRWQD